jgi:hypothetical protein
METELIKGEVEKVWHNKTSAGKRYDVINERRCQANKILRRFIYA